MHIAHVTSFYSVPALSPLSPIRSRGIAYRAAGHEFSVIVPGEVSSITRTDYGTLITVPARGTALLSGFGAVALRIRRTLDRLRPDRLEVADSLSARTLGTWAKENHVPAVLLADDLRSASFGDGGSLNYDRVVSDVEGNAGSDGDSTSETTVTIPQGVDLEIFTPLRHNSALRNSSDAELVVVCAAPLSRTGAVSIAIDTIRELRTQGVDVHLVVMGDGPLRSRLKWSAEGLGVQFLSANDLSLVERSEVFATADITLATDQGRSGRTVTLESLASGTPVILSRAIDNPIDFAAAAGAAGAGVPAGSKPGELARAIMALSERPVENRRRAARETSLRFDAMPLNRAMIELHESLGRSNGPIASARPAPFGAAPS